MSTIPSYEGWPLGSRQAWARELAARNRTDEQTIAQLRAQLADAQARAAHAEDQVRALTAVLESGGR